MGRRTGGGRGVGGFNGPDPRAFRLAGGLPGSWQAPGHEVTLWGRTEAARTGSVTPGPPKSATGSRRPGRELRVKEHLGVASPPEQRRLQAAGPAVQTTVQTTQDEGEEGRDENPSFSVPGEGVPVRRAGQALLA